jgi:hypothetical protein
VTEAQAIAAIIAAWRTGWEARQPGVYWTTENEVGASEATWARVSVRPSSSVQASMGAPGARRFHRFGTIAVQLFAPINAGDAAIAGMVDDVRAVLEGASFTTSGVAEPVKTFAASSDGRQTDGAWHMVMVSVPFRYQQTR